MGSVCRTNKHMLFSFFWRHHTRQQQRARGKRLQIHTVSFWARGVGGNVNLPLPRTSPTLMTVPCCGFNPGIRLFIFFSHGSFFSLPTESEALPHREGSKGVWSHYGEAKRQGGGRRRRRRPAVGSHHRRARVCRRTTGTSSARLHGGPMTAGYFKVEVSKRPPTGKETDGLTAV